MPSLSPEEISKYWEIFQQQNPANGFLSGSQMMGVLQNSQLPNQQLEKVWDLADIDGDGRMDFEEFCIAMRLVFDCLKTSDRVVPNQLPAWLVPATKQHLLDAKSALSGNFNNSAPSNNLMDDEDLALKQDFSWYISPNERREYETIYSVNSDNRGRLAFDSLNELYKTLNVPPTDVSSAWNLVNPKSEAKIDKEQSIVFLHILNQRHQGVRLPRSVPASLRATFGKEVLNYDITGPQAEIRRPSAPSASESTTKPGFSEDYMANLGLSRRNSQPDSKESTNSRLDSDWEEVRLKRELADLESRLARVDAAKRQQQQAGASNTQVVRRELQLLLEYKQSLLNEPSAPSADLTSVKDELETISEQLSALRDHHARRQQQLGALVNELQAL